MSAKVQSSSVALAVLSLPALSHVRPVMPLEMAPHTVLAQLFPPTPCSAAARLLSSRPSPAQEGLMPISGLGLQVALSGCSGVMAMC